MTRGPRNVDIIEELEEQLHLRNKNKSNHDIMKKTLVENPLSDEQNFLVPPMSNVLWVGPNQFSVFWACSLNSLFLQRFGYRAGIAIISHVLKAAPY